MRADPCRGLPPEEVEGLLSLARHSHRTIVENQQPGGAFPACQEFRAYRDFAWLRDGSFIAEGVSRYPDVRAASRFHDWVSEVLERRADQVSGLVGRRRRGEVPDVADMLPTRFTFDGGDGTADWWDFQTDGYGTWLWAVRAHVDRHGLDIGRWRRGVEVAVDYLVHFWDLPCYDWWEEHVEQRHVATLGAIYGGLRAAIGTGVLELEHEEAARAAAAGIRRLVAEQGMAGGRLAKWLGSDAVDASLAACVVPFELVAPGSVAARATLDAVARDLDVDGGVHRYAADTFYGGGQWLLLSCLLGWNRAADGDRDAALRYLRWVAGRALRDGDMPEQVPDHLLAPPRRQEWLDRWGPVATPLLWSHGMYLILADELGLLAGLHEEARARTAP